MPTTAGLGTGEITGILLHFQDCVPERANIHLVVSELKILRELNIA
jgi:hypothetical protein